MKCPVCNIKIPCVGGQDLNDGSMRQRRYKCPSCKRLIYTLEEITGVKEGRKNEGNS